MSLVMLTATGIILGNLYFYVDAWGNDLSQIKSLLWIVVGTLVVLFELIAGLFVEHLAEED